MKKFKTSKMWKFFGKSTKEVICIELKSQKVLPEEFYKELTKLLSKYC